MKHIFLIFFATLSYMLLSNNAGAQSQGIIASAKIINTTPFDRCEAVCYLPPGGRAALFASSINPANQYAFNLGAITQSSPSACLFAVRSKGCAYRMIDDNDQLRACRTISVKLVQSEYTDIGSVICR